MDEKTLQIYSSRLATERFDDVISAIECIQEMPREAGETALLAEIKRRNPGDGEGSRHLSAEP